MSRPVGELVWASVSKPMKTVIVSSVTLVLMLLCLERLRGQENEKPAKEKSKSSAATDRPPELAADLDEAIRMIEQNEFRPFVERYAPVEVLRALRQQGRVERFSKSFATQPKAKQQLLAFVKAVRKQAANVNTSRGLVSIQLDETGLDSDHETSELHLPVTDNLKLTGLGSDLKKVIADASQLLAKGDVRTVVERLFPASELARLQEPGSMEDLIQQFNLPIEPAVGPLTAQPQKPDTVTLLKAWQADFVQLQSLTPELIDDGKTALFHFESKDKQSERFIKFQKTGNDWRLFDNHQTIIEEMTRQSKLKPRSAVRAVQMELVGGNWRFIELPGTVK